MTEIDISECKFLIKEYIENRYAQDDGYVYIKNACGINGTECCLVPECYYRQLKRLEAENAKLKEKNVKLKSAVKEIKMGAIYGSVNSEHFLHNIFEDIIEICNEVPKDE